MDNEAQFKVEFHTISNKLITKFYIPVILLLPVNLKAPLTANSIDLIYPGK